MRALDILVLFDTPKQVYGEQAIQEYLLSPDWRDEKDVIASLRRLGHRPIPFALCTDLSALLGFLTHQRPDFVFFMCETFSCRRDLEAQLLGVLELLNIPHSGVASNHLQICKNKVRVKEILKSYEILVPEAIVLRRGHVPNQIPVPFPLIVKPIDRDASEGIAFNSVVTNHSDLKKRVAYLWNTFACDVVSEAFIDGGEYYVGLLGHDRPRCFHPVELVFSSDRPKVLTYRAKWNDQFRRKHGIRTIKARLSSFEMKRLAALSRAVYRALAMQGYARIDWRRGHDGHFFCLEVNPNPAIAKDDDFAKGARYAGVSYDEMIAMILRAGLRQRPKSSIKASA